MKILVVDDDENARLMLRNALELAGYEVIEAPDGRSALEALQDGTCRLVISDWEMPEMDGLDLCRSLRKDWEREYVYVILLTCHSDHQSKVRGLEAGADEFIAKPFDPAELTVRVRAGERVLALESREVTIFALAKLAESRDPETGSHLERVRGFCRIVAEDLARASRHRQAAEPDYVRMIYATSPLHDIGKVAVPDSVLLKPGRLSDREFEIMKTHTTLGAATLDAALRQFPSARFLRMARDIANSHHERFDGTGYPRNLVAEAIPLAGRIAALADVYDALISKRVYKQAYTHEVAKSIIVQESGTHFDPAVVQAFLDNEEAFIRTHGQFSELSQAA